MDNLPDHKYKEDLLFAEQIRTGNLDKLNDFTHRFYNEFKRWAKSGINEEYADDLAQEAFEQSLKAIKENRYKGKSSLYTYLRRIFTNTLIDYYKIKEGDSLKEDISNHDKDLLVDPTLDSILNKERKEIIIKAMKRLSGEYQQVIILTMYDGLSYEEAAKELDKTVGAFSGLVHRAIERLKKEVRVIEKYRRK